MTEAAVDLAEYQELKAQLLEDADPRPPAFTDEALALRYAEKHDTDLRFVAAWGRWFFWNGVHWEQDETLRAFDLARAICRGASAECNDKAANSIASKNTVAAVHSLARADRRLAATVDQWDRDLWLLNTPGGAVDLKTGVMRPHERTDYMTKVSAVTPEGDCPLWRSFLARITDQDEALQRYFQRMAGYALTGSTSAHALFFLYGRGANGKSVFINALSGIMGDYATTAPMETFIASNNDRHPTDLAGLRGARLVTATETEEGRRWNEAKIKALTGGDKISARFMRQNFFEFVPQFKLVIAGNHRPGLRNVDEAIRRRMNLVPFTVTIPAAERDLELSEKLKAEWPGILAWAVQGCVRWQADGLAPPHAVQEATTEYLDAEDTLAAWLDECCVRKLGKWSSTEDLFRSWSEWAERSGEAAGKKKGFSQRLQDRHFTPKRQDGTGKRGFAGIDLPNL